MLRYFYLCAALSLSACGGPGDDWNRKSGAPSQQTSYVDVWAFSETDVWMLDGSSTVAHYDGNEFSTIDTPSTQGLACIFARSATEVYLCAGSDLLLYDGSNFSILDASAVGMSGLTDVWASSPTDIWVVGEDAVVGHYDGTTWSRTIAGSPFNTSIWGSGPDDIYALGTFSLIHYDGSAWNEIDLDSSGDGQVWGANASNVWVMTGSYELSHYNGTDWQAVSIEDFVGDLTAVWGPGPDDLWAAGSAGSIAHYNGSSWKEVTHQTIGAPYLRQFLAVHGTSGSDVWAVGHQLGEGGSTGLIYHYEP